MSEWPNQLVGVISREVRTLSRTPLVWGLAIGFLGVILGTGLVNGTAGYVFLSSSLLTPIEFLLPVLIAALSYKAIVADRERDELSILRTYPVASETYIGGVYLGRLAIVLCIVLGTLLATGVLVLFSSSSLAVSQLISLLDSTMSYLQFVGFTGMYAAVILAIMTFLSATVRNIRQGLVLTVVAVSLIAIGFDLAIVFGASRDLIADQTLPWYIAFSPGSAYRELVIAAIIAPAMNKSVALFIPALCIVSLVFWMILSLVGAVWQAW